MEKKPLTHSKKSENCSNTRTEVRAYLIHYNIIMKYYLTHYVTWYPVTATTGPDY